MWVKGLVGPGARRLVGAASLAGVLVVASACGGSDGDSGSGDSSLGPVLTVTFKVDGEASLNGTTTTSAPTNNGKSPESCADYAKGSTKDDGRTFYVLPQFLKDKIEGKDVLIGALVTGYTGPGTYGLDKLSGEGTPAGISVDNRPYVGQQATTGQVVTDGKGGGTWTFTKLAFSDGDGTVSPGISGKVSWTCKG